MWSMPILILRFCEYCDFLNFAHNTPASLADLTLNSKLLKTLDTSFLSHMFARAQV